MRNNFYRTVVVLSFLIITTANISAQIDKDEVVPTAAPFLTISPESRGSAMGDAGVATAPDINSQHWNSSKYAFLDQDMGVSLSYTPWLRDLVDDINLYYLTFFKRIDKRQTFRILAIYRQYSCSAILSH